MSIIQSIRDKGARIAVVLIALSLIGFILMDAFSGRGSFFNSGASTTLGSINGKKIDQREFAKKIEIQEQNAQAQNRQLDEQGRQQLIAQTWNQEVTNALLESEYKKLGLTVGKKELDDMFYGQDISEVARQSFGAGQNGQYDVNAVAQTIAQIKKEKSENRKQALSTLIDAMKMERMTEKYKSLVAGTIHYPKWFLEKQNADNSLMAKISYVQVPYANVSDSTKEVEVTNADIEQFISKHSNEFEQYKQPEESRVIDYVLFSARPSGADSAVTKKQVSDLKAEFDSTKDLKSFLAKNSQQQYYESYISKSAIKNPKFDSILSVPVGSDYGPYADNDFYVLSRVVGVKQWPDTVNVRHILVSTQQRDDSAAKKIIDTIQLALKNGAKFDSLAAVYSEDPGSKDKGGLYENVFTGQMVPGFNEFIFDHKPGTIGVVKTDFGYHLIEILSQKGNSPAYKIAYLAKKIEASDATDQAASTAASQFAADSRDKKGFDANYDKTIKAKGILKQTSQQIFENDYNIVGIGLSRKFVKQVFDATKDEVMQPERIGDDYIVAVVTKINPAKEVNSDIKDQLRPVIRNKKKAELIKKRIGNITTLEAVANSQKQTVQVADSLRFISQQNTPLAFEYKVTGAAFNPANKGKIVPEAIEGTQGVYVIRVDNQTTTPVESADINNTRKALEAQGRMAILQANPYGGYQQRQYDPSQVLRASASIKDYRSKFY